MRFLLRAGKLSLSFIYSVDVPIPDQIPSTRWTPFMPAFAVAFVAADIVHRRQAATGVIAAVVIVAAFAAATIATALICVAAAFRANLFT